MENKKQKQEFVVTIRETIEKDFSIVADSEKEALNIAIEKHDNGDFDFYAGNVIDLVFETENEEFYPM